MIVELVGLPASGKTTLATQMVRQIPDLRMRRAAPPSPLRKIASKVHTVTKYRKPITVGVRGLAGDSRALSQKSAAVRWLVSTFECFTENGSGSSSTVLAEGPIQRGVLLFFDAGRARWNQKLLAKYMLNAPRSDLVIHLDVDPVLAVGRYGSRSEAEGGAPSRFESSPADLLTQFEAISEVLVRTLTEVSSTGTRVARVTSIEEGVNVARRAMAAAG